MENRKRNVHLHVMVTPDELAAIHERMAEAGISNAGAYVRKMALNGYILHIDLAPVKELISLQRRCSNNLNHLCIHLHANNRRTHLVELVLSICNRPTNMVTTVSTICG